MCGIFAVVQLKNNQDAGQKVFNGLQRLEYRGYDSWGVAVLSGEKVEIQKEVGKIGSAKKLSLPNSSIAIGHTRWATHGGVTKNNAHPHLSSDGLFSLAQNGVLENWTELKVMLQQQGFEFSTQTDTEVIVRLIEHFYRKQKKGEVSLRKAVLAAFREMKGRNTIILLSQEGKLIAARNGSPLLVGYHPEHQQYVCSSDVLSFADEVTEYAVIENGEVVEIVNGECRCFDSVSGREKSLVFKPLDVQHITPEKGAYPDFMLKEIHDTPIVINQVIEQPQEPLFQLAEAIKSARQVYCIGSGTAGIAAAQTAFYLRKYAHLQAVSLVGADASEYLPLFQKDDVIIAPSQSGETADVLEILEAAQTFGVKIVTYVNMPASSMTRMADFSFLAAAGPEISVVSTKVFVSQISWGYLVAKVVAGQYQEGLLNLQQLSTATQQLLLSSETHESIKALADFLVEKTDIFLLAKAENYQIIREGMVKLIEGSYIHAHALPSGDLKHYAITLIEPGTPVIVLTSNDEARNDVLTAAQEVKARGATVVHIGPEVVGEKFSYKLTTPDLGEMSAMMNVLPLQLLTHELAVRLGHDVDHPRNIAKSVTVK